MDYPLYVQFALRKDYNILTDNIYCVHLFADNSIKGHSNKALIAKVRRVLSQVKLRHNLSIGWTKAHTVWSSRAGSPWECGSGSPSGAREDGLNLRGGHGVRLPPSCPRIASDVYVREYAATRFRNCS